MQADEPVTAPPEPLRAAVAADFRASGAGRRLALVGVVAWLAYEWGIGNEVVTPWLLANVIGGNDGAAAIVAAGLVGFAFTTLQQLASGFTALAGFSMFERTSRSSWHRLRTSFESAPVEWSRLGWVGRSVLVFGLGTTAVALVQIMTRGVVGVRRHARAVVEGAFLCGAIVGIAGAGAAAVAVLGRSIPALEDATDWVLRVLGNPLFWLGVVVVVAIVHLARRPASRTS